MVRPILALAIWVVFVGGMLAYTNTRQETPPPVTRESPPVQESYALELTTTFPLEPDPFALTDAQQPDAPSLIVRLNGAEMLRKSGDILPGRPFLLDPLVGLVRGTNELYVQAMPPPTAFDRVHGVRIRVFRNGDVVVEQSLWSEPGTPIGSTVLLTTEPDRQTGK